MEEEPKMDVEQSVEEKDVPVVFEEHAAQDDGEDGGSDSRKGRFPLRTWHPNLQTIIEVDEDADEDEAADIPREEEEEDEVTTEEIPREEEQDEEEEATTEEIPRSSSRRRSILSRLRALFCCCCATKEE
ncbi:uncharacterized protein [Dendropsophus ebraccatus]|uniref:uncharacterized protein n=1 Tax=Dendropsophus ebraccatus TaxID=150705 RepID=UPI0038318FB2